MKKLIILISAVSGLAAFAVTAADLGANPVNVSTAAPVAPQKAFEPSIRHILMPPEQTGSCERANWPHIPAECLERVPTSGA